MKSSNIIFITNEITFDHNTQGMNGVLYWLTQFTETNFIYVGNFEFHVQYLWVVSVKMLNILLVEVRIWSGRHADNISWYLTISVANFVQRKNIIIYLFNYV